MAWIVPVIQGVSAVANMVGSAQANAQAGQMSDAQLRLMKLQEQYAKWTMTYGKEAADQLFAFVAGNDPVYQTMRAQMEAASNKDWNTAAQDTMMNYQRAGGGTLATSSGAQNMALALAKARAGGLATNRSNLMVQEQNQRLGVLGNLTNLGQQGSSTMGGLSSDYGNMSNTMYGRGSQMAGAAGELMRSIFSNQGTGTGQTTATPAQTPYLGGSVTMGPSGGWQSNSTLNGVPWNQNPSALGSSLSLAPYLTSRG